MNTHTLTKTNEIQALPMLWPLGSAPGRVLAHIRPLLLLLLLIAGSAHNLLQAQVTYKIINLRHTLATHYTDTDATAGSVLAVPSFVRSPLLADTDYTFYAESSVTVSGGTYTVKAGATPITTVPAAGATVYVVYTYTKTGTLKLDLGGQTTYYIIAHDPLAVEKEGNWMNRKTVYLVNEHTNLFSGLDGQIWNTPQWWPYHFIDSKDGATKQGYLWYLEGDDPYDIYLKSFYPAYNGSAGYAAVKVQNPPAMEFKNKGETAVAGVYSYFLNDEGDLLVANDKYTTQNKVDLIWRVAKQNNSHGSRVSYPTDTRDQFRLLHNFTITKTEPVWTFHVKTHVTGTTLKAGVISEPADYSAAIAIADKLKRKYCTYEYYLNYDEATDTYSDPVTTYQQVKDGTPSGNDYHIYVKYTVETGIMPFQFSTSYEEATWYRLYENNSAKYLYSYNSRLQKGNDLTYTNTYFYAFLGDPYELRIINMERGETRYLSLDNQTTESNYNNKQPIFDTKPKNYWELYDDGFDNEHFALRMFNTNIAYPLTSNDNPLQVSSTKTTAKLSVVEGKRFNYQFIILDRQGRIAMQQTAELPMGMALNYSRIPEAIRSEYIQDETVVFWSAVNKGAVTADGRTKYSGKTSANAAPAPANLESTDAIPLYVTYNVNRLMQKDLHLRGVRAFSMQLGEYAWANNSTELQKSATDSPADSKFWWHVIGNDPYAVQIQNVGADENKYFNISVDTGTTPPTVTQGMGGENNQKSVFVLMKSSVADDADQTITMGIVPIGGEGTVYTDNATLQTTEVKLVSRKKDVTYCLIDRSGGDKKGRLLLKSSPIASDEPLIPDDFRSPFLDNSQYHYYDASQIDEADGIYTPKAAAKELTSATDATGIIYVFYDACTKLTFSGEYDGTGTLDVEANRTQMYLLKYHDGQDFVQENGADGFDPAATKAVYPYNNGEANLYIYNQERLDMQMGQGASTRARWGWYIESPEHDPYRVRLTSHQTQTTTKVDNVTTNHHAYLRSYMPAGYEYYVTGVITNNPKAAAELPTEYMLLGTSADEVKLVTTYRIDGGAEDYDVASRYTVHSFEQYWKNNPTVLNLIYEYNDADSDEAKTAIQTRLNATGLTSAEKLMLRNRGWHSYNAWANINSWSSTSGKTYQYTDHWFETIEMGQTFNFEPFTVAPAVVLIDQHGWEIMRCPQSDVATLAKYNSPMVKGYHWWAESSKAPGYHKYTVAGTTVSLYEVQSDGKYYATGETYTLPTTTRLEQVPYLNLAVSQGYGAIGEEYAYTTGKTVKGSNDRRVDLYVTYEVKDEYKAGYTGGATEGAAGPSEFLVRQGGNYAVADGDGNIALSTVPKEKMESGDIDGITDAMMWRLKPNFYIDREMGYNYQGETGAQESAKTLEETEQDNYNSRDNGVMDLLNGRNGFDPYNLQIQNVATDTYLTTSLTSTAVNSAGGYSGTYADGNTLTLTDGTGVVNAVGHDQVNMRITNTTFMAVQDANGNMRLMPRFDHDRVLENFGIDSESNSPADAATVGQAAAQPANDQAHAQTTLLQIPKVNTYIIIDNQGREALRFVSADGEVKPTVKHRFKSPFAGDFKFYEEATYDDGAKTYTVNTADTIATMSLLSADKPTVYVRYAYDYQNDDMAVLTGGRFQMKVNGTAVDLVGTAIKSTAATGDYKWFSSAKATISPDPYAMRLFHQDGADPSVPVSITADGTDYDRFIILPFTDSDNKEFALMAPTTGTCDYRFVDGSDLTTGATVSRQTDYASAVYTTETPRPAKYKVEFTPRVPETVTYKIITNQGNVALTGTVTTTDLGGNYVAQLPAWMATPIMKGSAYRYYVDEPTKVTVDGVTTATVDPDAETHSVLNLGTDNIVYVRYDYNADTRQAVYTGRDGINGPYLLDLAGKQAYLFSNYARLWRDDKLSTDGSIYVNDASDALGMTFNVPLATRPLWLLEGNDPYEVTIRNKHFDPENKKVYAKMPTESDKDAKNTTYATPLKLYTDSEAAAAGYTYSTFMVLPARFYQTTGGDKHDDLHPSLVVTGQERLLVSRPNSSTDKMYVYQRADDQKTRVTHNTSASVEGHARFEFVPVVEYHIITNQGKQALTVWSAYNRVTNNNNNQRVITSDNTVFLPKFAQSPLLNETDFRYLTTAPTWDEVTQTLTEIMTEDVDDEQVAVNVVEAGLSFDDLLNIDTYKGGDIYVRYTYDRTTSPLRITTLDNYLNSNSDTDDGLDLSGSTWYNLANMYRGTNYGKLNTGGFLYTPTNGSDNTFGFTFTLGVGTSTLKTLSAKNLLWRLEGDDPYAIRIYNNQKGDDKVLTAPATGGTRYQYWTEPTTSTSDYQTFMYLNAKGYDERGGQGAGYPYWHILAATGYQVSDKPLILKTGDGGAKTSQSFDVNYNRAFTTLSDDMLYTGNGGIGNYYVTFFRANMTRRYRYHAMNCADGTPVEAWTAIIEHDWLKPVVLETAFTRRYAWYETKSTTFENAPDYDDTDPTKDIPNTVVTPTDIFDTPENLHNEAQFYRNTELTERIAFKDNGNTLYDFYPEIEEEQIYDIYFKYKPMSNDEIATAYPDDPFRYATADEIADDVATFADNKHLDKDNIQTPWFFMVLDTDDAMTVSGNADNRVFTGNQRFLRREDSGTVNWMNNSFALHALPEDNYKNYSCHRLAEWYKKGDNDAFREGRWLWAFMGDDPYNVRLLNMETAVGVTAEAQGVYTLQAADNCYATLTTTTDAATGRDVHPVVLPGEAPQAGTDHFTWGICAGYGDERTLRLQSSELTTTADAGEVTDLLYWQMGNRGVEARTLVTKDRSQAIQLIPYQPVQYEDVNIVIRRDDDVEDYLQWRKNYRDSHDGAEPSASDKMQKINSYESGISKLYFAASERMFEAGDIIDMSDINSLPLYVRRAFCKYTLYRDDYDTEGGDYTVQKGPYPTGIQATSTGYWEGDTYRTNGGTPLYDDDGRIVYAYRNADNTPAPEGAQSIYAKYQVTSDIFLKTMPTQEQVKEMAANNDHVYFMDFPDTDSRGNDNTHHAFFDSEASFLIQTGDLSQKKDKNTGVWRTEKKHYNETLKRFEDDYSDPYNSCQFRTDGNRMTSVPEDLKWYFVGDPYRVQVYNTAGAWNTEDLKDKDGNTIAGKEAGKVAANLARINPIETNFQFVVDCVHMQVPDYAYIDDRTQLYPTDSLNNVLDPIPNRNYGKPYYNDFYWEVVPATSTDPDAFALRFKEDNDLLGYRNVYYYLAHEGLTKRYREDNGEHTVYHVNLNYNPGDDKHESGPYINYHTANDKNTVIRLVQPVRVYITATKGGTPVVTDELSEYYGLDEMLDAVPRHLQRKFVNYDAMQHEMTVSNAYSKQECNVDAPADPEHPASYKKRDHITNEVLPTYKNIVFKYNVGYTVNDLTSNGIHLFSTCADPANPKPAELQWLDMTVGDGNWTYYDKLNVDEDGKENQTALVSNYRRALSDYKTTGWNNNVNGWSDGLKGLHFALIGDPYNFTILNRRRYEDNRYATPTTTGTDPMWLTVTKTTIPDYLGTVPSDSVVWTTSLTKATDKATLSTDIAAKSNTEQVSHFSVQMWKWGGDNDYFLRTASLKTGTDDYSNTYTDASGNINQTNNYWRMIAKNYLDSTPYSFFEMVPYSLSDKSRLTDNRSILTYDNYVNNNYGYSKTLSGDGPLQQRLTLRTVIAIDNDGGDNDCFDSDVRIYTNTGILRIKKDNMEIKYDEASDAMPFTLRRYGCTYDCYLVTTDAEGNRIDSVLVNDFDAAATLTSSDPQVDGKTFRQFIDNVKTAGTHFHLSYIYHVTEEAQQYFTTVNSAQTDDYTWMNTYFAWNQTYTGTNVEVERYKREFDHYVYNEQGQVIDEVWVMRRYTEVIPNPTEAYPTTAYLNSHTNQNDIFADEGTQSENDRQKWALVGDPYEFNMKNYAQYLIKNTAVLKLDGKTATNTYIGAEAVNFALTLDKNGNTFLTLIDKNGEAITSITFDFGNASDKKLRTQGGGTNQNDPTGNTYDTDGVKPFKLTNLLRYADILQYHLVIAHQHSLDPEDVFLKDINNTTKDKAETLSDVPDGLSDAQKALIENKTQVNFTGQQMLQARQTLRQHLLEWLMYRGIGRNEPTMYVNYKDNDPKTLQPVSYRTDDAEMEDKIKKLLKQNASLRDFISYPIDDYSVSRVGIGNHPQVPWYMKRQFCRYFLYQKDVLRSDIDYDCPSLEEADADWTGPTVNIGGTLYKVDDSSDYKVDVTYYDGKIYLSDKAPGTGTEYKDVVQRTFEENDSTMRAYNIKWVSIFDRSSGWTEWTDKDTEEATTDPVLADRKVTIDGITYKAPKYYKQALALQGKVLDKLQDCHFNRMVKIDVVYEVIPEEFKFSDRDRNTTAWYQMMTNNEADGLMNFTYREGIGARMDRTEHYTNNYLWAPEGDPYGFVLHSRYATINGTGWDDVVVTTTGLLPTETSTAAEVNEMAENAASTDASKNRHYHATYTSKTKADDNARFVNNRIIHLTKGQKRTSGDVGSTVATNGAVNATYEMFTGDAAYPNSFLMHPTSAYVDTKDTDYNSFFLTHNTVKYSTLLTKTSGRELQTNADANWSLRVTPEQLWPYFDRAGYVGGLKPERAVADFAYQSYYEQLRDVVAGTGPALDFLTLRKIQEVVYEGTFKDNTGEEVPEGASRPAASLLPMTFESQNLVNMTAGYYRIRAFSQKPLDIDGNDMSKTKIKGITGPRYISGYRFESEKTDPNDDNNDGGRWLHFLETDMAHSDIHTFADLKAKIAAVNTAVEASDRTSEEKAALKDRDVFDHVAMRGNIEILPADFDPSSIFHFTETKSPVGKYNMWHIGTQGLRLYARPGGTEGEAEAHKFGRTELCDPTVGPAAAEKPELFSDQFRLTDIGGAAVTLRTLKYDRDDKWDDDVNENLKTNYLCIDRHHRYRITCHTDNEMVEIGDHSDNHGTYGIQDTKWLLQPVGIREEWPYNEMPLRVEVQQGGVKNYALTDPDLSSEGNKDKYYYGSLYVPFDTRLGNTTDAAFTLTSEPTSVGTVDTPGKVTMSSVSRLNEMGNPQFVPANWPVVLRTNNDKNVVELVNQGHTEKSPNVYATRHYVNMYIPNNKPTVISNALDGEKVIKLRGQYLEKTLTDADLDGKTTDKTVMVFGLPFEGGATHTSHEYDTKMQVGWFSNHNWMRGYGKGTIVGGTGEQPTTNDGSAAAAFLADARNATDAQRSNLYVYHNKAYYVYTEPASPVRYSIVVFDDDLSDDPDDDPYIDVLSDDVPWPCAVYDLQGRRVAERETPATLRHNHPALPRGVYIFGTRKVVVR